jgi:hypothetical protein
MRCVEMPAIDCLRSTACAGSSATSTSYPSSSATDTTGQRSTVGYVSVWEVLIPWLVPEATRVGL